MKIVSKVTDSVVLLLGGKFRLHPGSDPVELTEKQMKDKGVVDFLKRGLIAVLDAVELPAPVAEIKAEIPQVEAPPAPEVVAPNAEDPSKDEDALPKSKKSKKS